MDKGVKDKNSSNSKKSIKNLLEFDFRINKDNFTRIIPFILYLSFLMLLYIANKNYSEKCILELDHLNQELKDLRAESLTIKAELMNKTKQSEVERMCEEIGLKGVSEPHKKIVSE